MTKVISCALAAIALCAQPCAGQGTDTPSPHRGGQVGWILPEGFSDTADADFAFYPEGEGAQQWGQRIQITEHNLTDVPGANEYLSKLGDEYRQRCPDLRTETIFAEVVESIDNAVQMWHCPAQADDGLGTVVLIKAIVDGPAIHLAESRGRFPAFAKDASPLPAALLNSWAAFLNSFILCSNRLNPSCLPKLGELVMAETVSPTAQESVSVALSESRGASMHRKDQLARRATEILGAQKNLRWKSSVTGWVTVLDDDGGVDVVWFMGGSRRRPRPYYAIVFEPGGSGRFYDYKKYKASDTAVAMFRARESALAAMEQACTPSVNTVVLQHESGSGWLVYVLSAGINVDEVYIGGHTRYSVDAEGKRVLETSALSESCLVLKKTRSDRTGKAQQAWYSMIHLQHATPLETHLFQSLNHRLRFFVHTSSGDWRVETGAITKLMP